MNTVALPAAGTITVLVPAAGSGDRLGLGPKALLPLDGRPVVEWVLRKAALLADEVIVALPAGAPALESTTSCTRIVGGATRQDSVLLLALQAARAWVLVWDAARPFTSVALARRVLAEAVRTGGAAAASSGPGEFQTPLAFPREVLLRVTTHAAQLGWAEASTIALVLRAGLAVTALPNEAHNIKLTTADDWAQAQGLLAHLREI
ncbi:MAG: 2-C-methyl-D-erythritol 4-phosphate cytidylyltransferase [Burkholderiales bacterium]|nr:2-C-methyl-D-erythritol 4-phosphate cytidylyltransferase [Burkholderiales bacterium]